MTQKTILRYVITKLNEWQSLTVPRSFTPLSCQWQPLRGVISLWGAIDKEVGAGGDVELWVLSVGTGIDFEIPPLLRNIEYLATTQTDAGFVWHTFWADKVSGLSSKF